MENAIRIAIEGGYNNDEILKKTWGTETEYLYYQLDPLFWQALGKAEGWNKHSRVYWLYMTTDTPTQIKERWQNEMHSFVDWISEGKSVESFFEELLINKN